MKLYDLLTVLPDIFIEIWDVDEDLPFPTFSGSKGDITTMYGNATVLNVNPYSPVMMTIHVRKEA